MAQSSKRRTLRSSWESSSITSFGRLRTWRARGVDEGISGSVSERLRLPAAGGKETTAARHSLDTAHALASSLSVQKAKMLSSA